MLGTQFHPELKSRPNRPHPLFRDFIEAAWELRGAQPGDPEPAARRNGASVTTS
jgi:CTP synthase